MIHDLVKLQALRPECEIVQVAPCIDHGKESKPVNGWLILWDDDEVTALRTDGQSRLLTEEEKAGVLGP